MVGAVILGRHGELVGEGFHVRAGGPHAERHALAAAGDKARGGTLYCTLEPCNHTGRTGPCTEAVIEAGIRRVVLGAGDPNPQVSGTGIARLRAAGIEVVEGVLVDECTALNEVFNHWIVTRRPHVTLKLATSLDGRIAAASGQQTRITGPIAQRRVHELRAQADAVLVGSQTVLVDDPRLSVRGLKPLTVLESTIDQPRAVVLDSHLKTPLDANVCRPGTVLATALSLAELAKRSGPYVSKGVELWSVPATDGAVDLVQLLERLGRLEGKPVSALFVEGGGKVAAAFLEQRLVNRWLVHVGPKVIGSAGVAAVASMAHPDGDWDIANVRRLGADVELEVRPCSRD